MLPGGRTSGCGVGLEGCFAGECWRVNSGHRAAAISTNGRMRSFWLTFNQSRNFGFSGRSLMHTIERVLSRSPFCTSTLYFLGQSVQRQMAWTNLKRSRRVSMSLIFCSCCHQRPRSTRKSHLCSDFDSFRLVHRNGPVARARSSFDLRSATAIVLACVFLNKISRSRIRAGRGAGQLDGYGSVCIAFLVPRLQRVRQTRRRRQAGRWCLIVGSPFGFLVENDFG